MLLSSPPGLLSPSPKSSSCPQTAARAVFSQTPRDGVLPQRGAAIAPSWPQGRPKAQGLGASVGPRSLLPRSLECWSPSGTSVWPVGATFRPRPSSALRWMAPVSSGGKPREAQAVPPGKGDVRWWRCLLQNALLHWATGSMEVASPAASFWASGSTCLSLLLVTPAV